MKSIVSDTIEFLSKTYPKLYSKLYLEHLKQYSTICNLNKTQLRALVFIKNYGSISMTDLCSKLNIEKGSLTSMIDDLTEKGYVTRERDLSDRRKYVITMTNEGIKVASEFMDVFKIRLEEKLFRLSEEDRKRYIEAIHTLEYILNKEELN